jgi:hypothetical protein
MYVMLLKVMERCHLLITMNWAWMSFTLFKFKVTKLSNQFSRNFLSTFFPLLNFFSNMVNIKLIKITTTWNIVPLICCGTSELMGEYKHFVNIKLDVVGSSWSFHYFKVDCVFVFHIYDFEILVLDSCLYLFVSFVIITICYWCIYNIITFGSILMQYML